MRSWSLRVPSINTYPIPPSVPPEHRGWVQELFTYWLARFDPRNANNDFKDGLVADETGKVTLGTQAIPVGRTASVAALTNRIANTGKATDQRFLPTVSVSNRLSAQNTDPLTSISDASTATITIAAHTVQYGAGLVSYSGGTISGAPVDTTLYVYGDDSDLQGGAVAYSYTTNPQTVVASNNRYYVGSIRTSKNAATANVSGATQANPCVITTSSAHGFDTGDTVTFSSVGGMTELNALPATAITKINATSFSLNGVNSTAYGAYTSGGTVTRANTSASGGGGGGGWAWGFELP